MNNRKFFYLLLAALSPFSLAAQDQLGSIAKGSLADANYLVKGYVSPVMNLIGGGLNQGWYNTGAPHKIAGVDITLSISAVGIPDADRFFTVDNTKLTNVSLVRTHDGTTVGGSGTGSVPTIFGPSTTPRYRYDSGTEEFDGPPGVDLKGKLGINRLPVPVIQLGFGLPKGTDLKLRYIPTLSSSGTAVKMFGIGVLHDVKQWIPVINHVPFELSGFVGFTSFNVTQTLSGPGQTGVFDVKATTIQALISKKLAVLTVYGGVGYNIAKSTIALKGSYDFDGAGTGPQVTNPIDINVSNSGPRLTAGMRLKLAIFTFHGDYTLQKASTITAGFGISVR